MRTRKSIMRPPGADLKDIHSDPTGQARR